MTANLFIVKTERYLKAQITLNQTLNLYYININLQEHAIHMGPRKDYIV